MEKIHGINTNEIGVSIVVCCYNSSTRLPDTLRHLALQKLIKPINWEIIVVDNASTDNTSEVAINEWLKYGVDIPFRVIKEKKTGLSNARIRGVNEALFEYIVFCDDDNWLKSDYIYTAFSIMESNRGIGLLGGQSRAVSNIEFPDWFTTFQKSYAVGVQNLFSGDVSKSGMIWGAGMVLRKSFFLNLLSYGFNSLLIDRRGEELSSGGDVEICKWYLIAKYLLWYDERLVLNHYISANRLSKEYLNKLHSSFKVSWDKISYYDIYIYDILNQKNSILMLLKFIFHLLRYLFTKNKYSKIYVIFLMPLSICLKLNIDIYHIRVLSNMINKKYN